MVIFGGDFGVAFSCLLSVEGGILRFFSCLLLYFFSFALVYVKSRETLREGSVGKVVFI